MALTKYAIIRGNATTNDRIIGSVFLNDPDSYNPGRMRYIMLWDDAIAAGYTEFAQVDPEEYKIELADQLRNAIAANRTFIANSADPATIDLPTLVNQTRRLTGAVNRLIRFALVDFNPNEPV